MKALAICVMAMTLNLTVMAQTLPDPIKQSLARSGVGANNELLASPEDQRALYQFVKQSWRDFLPKLNALNLDANQQQLLIQATIEALPDQDYLPFVTAALRLFSEGKLAAPVGAALLMPSKSDKEGFLAMNYQNPELANALRAAVPRYGSNPQMQTFATGILSGTEKERHVKWMTEQGLQARPPVTTAAINPTPDPAAATPAAATPTRSTPVPTATPATPSPAPAVAESPAPVVERKSPVWPWVVGIAALIAILALIFKRRALLVAPEKPA
jgi:hypothetical protein